LSSTVPSCNLVLIAEDRATCAASKGALAQTLRAAV